MKWILLHLHIYNLIILCKCVCRLYITSTIPVRCYGLQKDDVLVLQILIGVQQTYEQICIQMTLVPDLQCTTYKFCNHVKND
jgi:hypothetical protein